MDNTLEASGDSAGFWRRRMPAHGGDHHRKQREDHHQGDDRPDSGGPFRVLQTEGNLNNLIGLPLMLLRLSPEHELAVLEMGMKFGGDIWRLEAIAHPHVSLITNIGRAHLEFLGIMEGIARAKGEIWAGLGPEDWIAVNAG